MLELERAARNVVEKWADEGGDAQSFDDAMLLLDTLLSELGKERAQYARLIKRLQEDYTNDDFVVDDVIDVVPEGVWMLCWQFYPIEEEDLETE